MDAVNREKYIVCTARLQNHLVSAKEYLDKPWPQEDEYQIKVVRLNELNLLLNKKDVQPQLDMEQPRSGRVQ